MNETMSNAHVTGGKKMAGRPMKPIPEDTPEELARLARTLRELREQTGNLPLADLARRAHIAKSTLHHALSGERLPSQQTLFHFINACSQHAGVNPEPVQQHTMRLWREARQATRPADSATERPSTELELWRQTAATPPARRRHADDAPTRPGTTSAEAAETVYRYAVHGADEHDHLTALRRQRMRAEGEARVAMARLQEAVASMELAQAVLQAASRAERDALERDAETAAASARDIPGTRTEL
ncbi:helix-turn-helix domain-containing protein [Streptomyces goshikiensis]